MRPPLPTSNPPPNDSGKRKLISIVTPIFNELDLIEQLTERLVGLAESQPQFDWEWVAVDDGSTDESVASLRKLLPRFPNWKLICLSRNFGQQAAFRAGLDGSTGDAVVFLDADLQDPPELIPELLTRWESGARVVVGVRRSRPERGLRGWLLKAYHPLFSFLTKGAIPANSGTFGLMDRIVADEVRRLPETNLFLPGLRSWVGYRRDIILYDREARLGDARQTYAKLLNYAWDGITSFSELPLRLIFWLGILVSMGGFLYVAFLSLIRLLQAFGFFLDYEVLGFTTLAIAVISLGGVQLVCLGVVGEYCGRIYREVKRRPIYVIDQGATSASS